MEGEQWDTHIVQGRLTHHQAHFLPAVPHQLYDVIPGGPETHTVITMSPSTPPLTWPRPPRWWRESGRRASVCPHWGRRQSQIWQIIELLLDRTLAEVNWSAQYHSTYTAGSWTWHNCPRKCSHLTMTGFSEPATKPKPSSGCLSRVTSLGSGISSESVAPHFLGSSYVDVLLMWLKEEN